jgi:hypothetical protein
MGRLPPFRPNFHFFCVAHEEPSPRQPCDHLRVNDRWAPFASKSRRARALALSALGPHCRSQPLAIRCAARSSPSPSGAWALSSSGLLACDATTSWDQPVGSVFFPPHGPLRACGWTESVAELQSRATEVDYSGEDHLQLGPAGRIRPHPVRGDRQLYPFLPSTTSTARSAESPPVTSAW